MFNKMQKYVILMIVLCTWQIVLANEDDYKLLVDLPPDHFSCYLNAFPEANQYWCAGRHSECTKQLEKLLPDTDGICWGYESDCLPDNRYIKPQCSGDHTGWVASKSVQVETFFTQADFGYIRQQNNEMMVMCEPLFPGDSVLECSKYARFCRGRNLMIDFGNLLNNTDQFRYKTDVLSIGHIGGYCKYHEKRLKTELEHFSALQSWAPEMRNFVELPQRPLDSGICDRIIDKPTFIMKIDAGKHFIRYWKNLQFIYQNLSYHCSGEHVPSLL